MLKLKSILTILLCFVFAAASFAQKPNMTPAKKNIKEVIESETMHFNARDYKKWKKAWVHEDYIVWTVATKDGVRQYKGWESWSNEVKELFASDPEPRTIEIKKFDYNFHVYNGAAWVTFKEREGNTITDQVRFLEKRKGKWKIVFVEVVFNPNSVITVDKENQDRSK